MGKRYPTTLDEWPDVIARPTKLIACPIDGAGYGCCVSMHIARELGYPDWEEASGLPVTTLERLGLPYRLACEVVERNDSRVGTGNRVERSFDWLMRRLGYEIVEIDA